MATYRVKQGDHLSSIAHDFGFSDYRTIWDDANNASLKAKRNDPNILLPGDVLFIPDRQPGEYSGATNQRHKFTTTQPKLKLRIVLCGHDAKPLPNTKCTLVVEGEAVSVTSESDGSIEHPISPGDKSARITFTDPKALYEDRITINIGSLDPIDTLTGQAARLSNLGYFLGDTANPDADDLKSAIEEFQCDNRLTVDGKCGPNTQSKLKSVYGC